MESARLVAVRVVAPGVHLWLLRVNSAPVRAQRVVVFADGTPPLYFGCDFDKEAPGEITIRWPQVRVRGEARSEWSLTTRPPTRSIGQMVDDARHSLLWLISPTVQMLEESFQLLCEMPRVRESIRAKYEKLQNIASHHFPATGASIQPLVLSSHGFEF